MKHMYCTPVLRSGSLTFLSAFTTEFKEDSDTKVVQSKHLSPLHTHGVHTSLHRGKTNKQSKMILFESHARSNHPALPFPQLSDDALSPSYLTQVTGSTFDKRKRIVFISEDLENVVGFYENLWLLYQTYLHREMFLSAVLHTLTHFSNKGNMNTLCIHPLS